MKPIQLKWVVGLAILVMATFAHVVAAVDDGQPASVRKGDELQRLEKLIHGHWHGPACGGDYKFQVDGTFELTHFSPGNNCLTGTWAIRWEELPPKLMVTYKTSDIRKNDPTRIEFEHLGKTVAYRLVELNKDSMSYQIPEKKSEWRFSRSAEEGGSSRPID